MTKMQPLEAGKLEDRSHIRITEGVLTQVQGCEVGLVREPGGDILCPVNEIEFPRGEKEKNR